MKPMFLVSHPKPGVTEYLGCALQIAYMIWFFARRDLRFRLALQLLFLVARILSSFIMGYEFLGAVESIMTAINSVVG